jgi:hypothetical protein
MSLGKKGKSWQCFERSLGLISEQRKPLHRRRAGGADFGEAVGETEMRALDPTAGAASSPTFDCVVHRGFVWKLQSRKGYMRYHGISITPLSAAMLNRARKSHPSGYSRRQEFTAALNWFASLPLGVQARIACEHYVPLPGVRKAA